MMRTKYISASLVFLLPFLASCSSSPAKKLQGTWTVDRGELMSMMKSLDSDFGNQSPEQQAALRDEMARDFGPITFTKKAMISKDARTGATLEQSYEVLEAEQRQVRLVVERPDGQTANLNLELGENDDTLRLILDDNPKLRGAYIPYQRSIE